MDDDQIPKFTQAQLNVPTVLKLGELLNIAQANATIAGCISRICKSAELGIPTDTVVALADNIDIMIQSCKAIDATLHEVCDHNIPCKS